MNSLQQRRKWRQRRQPLDNFLSENLGSSELIRVYLQNFVKSHMYPRFKGAADTKHGTVNESQAREDFEQECLGGGKDKHSGKTEPFFQGVYIWDNSFLNKLRNLMSNKVSNLTNMM